MTGTVITYRLDLVIQLTDTTTGKAIREKNVRFTGEGKVLRPIDKGDAGYILLDHGREDFSLKVSVFGYEEIEVPVCYDKLDKSAPTIAVYLLPLDTKAAYSNVITLQGNMPGLEAIEAVSLGPTYCNVKEFDERKRIITLANPHKLPLSDVHYGIINQEKDKFEHVQAVKNVSENALKLDRVVELEHTEKQSIARIIFGMVRADGSYILRVRDDGSDARYLIRYRVNGNSQFKTMTAREISGDMEKE